LASSTRTAIRTLRLSLARPAGFSELSLNACVVLMAC
jgi:hypothetical protein